MQGASRVSLAAARDALASRADDPSFRGLSEELLAVSALLGRESGLRSALTDPGDSPERRRELAAGILTGQASPLAVDVVGELVAQRWSSGRDMVDAVEALGVDAAFTVAERDGVLDSVEDELFRFARIVDSQPALRSTLTDPAVPNSNKSALVGDLLAGKASEVTVRLATHVAANPRGRRLEDALDVLVGAAAVRREQLLAEVTVATALTMQQHERLAAALSRLYGRSVNLQVSIDPDVRGGVVVRVGEELIDGSIAHRLAEARRVLGG